MADDTHKVTADNRETVLRLALAIASLKDVDATVPVRRQQMEQEYEQKRQAFERRAEVERQRKLDAMVAVQKELVGDLEPGAWVEITKDGSEYVIHRQGAQLKPLPDKAKGKTKRRAARTARKQMTKAAPDRKTKPHGRAGRVARKPTPGQGGTP